MWCAPLVLRVLPVLAPAKMRRNAYLASTAPGAWAPAGAAQVATMPKKKIATDASCVLLAISARILLRGRSAAPEAISQPPELIRGARLVRTAPVATPKGSGLGLRPPDFFPPHWELIISAHWAPTDHPTRCGKVCLQQRIAIVAKGRGQFWDSGETGQNTKVLVTN